MIPGTSWHTDEGGLAGIDVVTAVVLIFKLGAVDEVVAMGVAVLLAVI